MTDLKDEKQNNQQDRLAVDDSRRKLEQDREEFHRQLSVKESRKRRARSEKDETLRRGFSAFGVVGWSIVVPALIGIAIGLWLDQRLDGGMRYTLSFLIGGVIIGMINAWNWVNSRK